MLILHRLQIKDAALEQPLKVHVKDSYKANWFKKIEFLKRHLIPKKTETNKEWEHETNSKMGDLNPLCQ